MPAPIAPAPTVAPVTPVNVNPAGVMHSASGAVTGYNQGSIQPNMTPLGQSTVVGTPAKPQAVISSTPAQTDYQTKQTNFNNLNTAVQNHTVTVANNKATAASNPSIVDYLNSTGKPSSFADRSTLAKTYGIQNYSGTADQNTQLLNTIRNKDITDQQNAENDPNGTLSAIKDAVTAPTTTDTTTPTDPLQTQQDNADTQYQNDLNNLNNESDTALTSFQNTISQIQNGTFPLSAGEQAQVTALNSQFDQLRQQQMLANQNYVGGVTQAQAMTGNSYYSPQIAMGNIANAVNVGIQKLADLATKQSVAMTKLEASFQANDYKIVQGAYTALQKTFTDRANAIEKMHTAITNEVNKLRTYNEKVAQDSFNNAMKSDTLDFRQKEAAFGDYIKQATLSETQLRDANNLMMKQFAASNKAPNKAQQLSDATATVGPQLEAVKDENGYITDHQYRTAKAKWVNSGLSGQSFDDAFSQYVYTPSASTYGLNKYTSTTASYQANNPQ